MSRVREALLYAGLALVLLLPRLPGLDSFATADEPYWLSMGANFYYALGQREFQYTIYEYQPAVTTMWLVTAALLIYFPEYRGIGQGYLDFEKGLLDPFLHEHGRDPLILLRETRLLQVILITGLLVFAFHLCRKLVGTLPALAAVLMASFDPFYLGHSRLLDHEALLGVLCVISVTALMIYLLQSRQLAYLVISAVAAGLAQLTKSSGLALLVPIGIVFLIHWIEERRSAPPRVHLIGTLRTIGLWLAVLALTYFIFWPGMWVAPGKMLYEVYGNAFSYALRGARLIAFEDPEAAPFVLDADPGGAAHLLYGVVRRTTPVMWLGLLGALSLPFMWKIAPQPGRDEEPVPRRTAWLSLTLFGLAAAFLLMFGVAQGRNSPHYVLTSYLALGMLSGLGWVHIVRWLGGRLTGSPVWAPGVILLAAGTLHAATALTSYPYYFTYENPIVRGLAPVDSPPFAYGEALEQAAHHLAALPDAQDSTALVYYSRGSFSYFFPGRTERFKPYYVDAGHEADLEKALAGADYLVIYYAIQGHAEKYAPLLDALASAEPEAVIWMNGYKYVVIYRVEDIPDSISKGEAQ